MTKKEFKELKEKDKELQETREQVEETLKNATDEEITAGIYEIIDMRNFSFRTPEQGLSFLIQNQIMMAEAIRRLYKK